MLTVIDHDQLGFYN